MRIFGSRLVYPLETVIPRAGPLHALHVRTHETIHCKETQHNQTQRAQRFTTPVVQQTPRRQQSKEHAAARALTHDHLVERVRARHVSTDRLHTVRVLLARSHIRIWEGVQQCGRLVGLYERRPLPAMFKIRVALQNVFINRPHAVVKAFPSEHHVLARGSAYNHWGVRERRVYTIIQPDQTTTTSATERSIRQTNEPRVCKCRTCSHALVAFQQRRQVDCTRSGSDDSIIIARLVLVPHTVPHARNTHHRRRLEQRMLRGICQPCSHIRSKPTYHISIPHATPITHKRYADWVYIPPTDSA